MRNRPPLPRCSLRRFGAVVLAVAVLSASAPGASATTRTRLHDARAKLASLTDQIRAEEARSSALQGQLAALDTEIAGATTKAQRIAAELAVTRDELAAAKAEYEGLRGRLDALARNAYMQGPGSGIDVVLGATSIDDLNDRIQFLSAFGQQTMDLADHVATVAGRLAETGRRLGTLLSEQQVLLAQLSQEHNDKSAAIQQVRQSLADLDKTRTQIVALVAKLRKQLRAEEIASIGGSFQGGSNLPYGEWAGAFLRTMGVTECHDNLVAVVSWQVAEFTQSAWNPLATTYTMPGSTVYNWAGVQNYVSLAQGLEATKLTIQDGWSSHGYGGIVSALSRCADPMSTAAAVNASDWCSGCAGGNYVTDMVAKVEANYAIYAAL
jgi:peptidoglycan hydrolase CwlO-like protein